MNVNSFRPNGDFITELYNAVQDKSLDNVNFGFQIKSANDGGRRHLVRVVQPNVCVGEGIRKALLVSLGRAGLSQSTMSQIKSMLDGTREHVSRGLAMERPVTGRTIRQIFNMALPESQSGLFSRVQKPTLDTYYDMFDKPHNSDLRAQPKKVAPQVPKMTAKEIAWINNFSKLNAPKTPVKKVSTPKVSAPKLSDAKRMRIADAMANLALKRYHLSFDEFRSYRNYLEVSPDITDNMSTRANDKAWQHMILDESIDAAFGNNRSSRRW